MDKNTDLNLLEDFNDFYKECDLNLIADLAKGIDIEGEVLRNEGLLCYLSDNREENPENSKVIRDLSVAIVQYIFRNGPVERMHSGKHSVEYFTEIPPDAPLKDISQLSDHDMKILNTYMVDRVGYLLTMFQKADYTKIKRILRYYILFGASWDSPKIEKLEEEYNESVLRFLRSYKRYKKET